MYFNVAPLTHIPIDRDQFFTYGADIEYFAGDLVEIPLGRKKTRGVVLGPAKKPNFNRIRNISKKIEPGLLSNQQLQQAQWLAERYYCSLGLCLKLFIPKVVSTARVKERLYDLPSKEDFELTKEQFAVFDQFKKDISKQKPFLLFGPTGSGKTEVYMRMMSHTKGQALLIVPEISLVPQNILRFMANFPEKNVVFLHSKLSGGERYKAWQEIKNGSANIIIGPRSALFSPFKNLGLIIIDEEHDQSLKQFDKNPRYHAVDFAEFISEQKKIPLVLGSATPEVEHFFKAQNDDYILLSLSSRFHQDEMPEVEIVDMKEEFKKKNFSIFSESMVVEMEEVLERGKQVVLFINRRGAASFVTCRTCGFVEECESCNLPYTYHIFGKNQGLVCHHCGRRKKAPHTCSECQSKAIKFLGGGTEKVYAALHSLFPKARIERMDKDTTSRKGAHEKIFKKFKAHEIDILVGTQMISKGWDMPKVDLVGIVSADVGLHFPDFRASERVFQLLTQVAGRTGRKHSRGKVVLQTYYPEHEVIQAVRNHDFVSFYESDIESRRDLLYPPFSNIAKLIIESKSEGAARRKAEKIRDDLGGVGEDVTMLGPAPSFFSGVNGVYVQHIVLKFPKAINEQQKKLLKKIEQDAKIDIDPITLL